MNNQPSQHQPDHPNPDHGASVTIEVNTSPVQIHRGHQTVAQIKTAAGVALAEVLTQIIDGKIIELPDDGGVTIKGGEKFVSHVRSGAGA